MSKILDASCSADGKVTADGAEVPEALVLSEGKQESTGVLFIDGDKPRYMPSSATDIKATLDNAVAAIDSIGPALTKIATALTSIGAGMTGPTTAPPPTLVTDVAEITAKVAELNATKAQINQLKGALK